MPGIGVSFNHLTQKTALLPSIRMEAPRHVIGPNSIECMQSGAIFGTASMLDGMCERIEQELGYPTTVVATGGLGRMVVPYCRRPMVYDDNLLLEGLRLIYEKNIK